MTETQMYILSVCIISYQLWLPYIQYVLCLIFWYILNSFCIFNHFSTSGQSNTKIEELLQEDHNAKRRREKYKKQSSLLSKLTRQLSISMITEHLFPLILMTAPKLVSCYFHAQKTFFLCSDFCHWGSR